MFQFWEESELKRAQNASKRAKDGYRQNTPRLSVERPKVGACQRISVGSWTLKRWVVYDTYRTHFIVKLTRGRDVAFQRPRSSMEGAHARVWARLSVQPQHARACSTKMFSLIYFLFFLFSSFSPFASANSRENIE